MKFRLIIDKDKEEEVVVTAHEESGLTEQLRLLVTQAAKDAPIIGYIQDDMQLLTAAELECITVLDGKTFAIDSKNRRFRLKQRLYELEAILPSNFIRINKSTLANETALERFAVTYTGSVDAVFKCGYREYVSRRCFAQIKRRLEKK
ncbi:MAG: LytTR family transcriptional regulator [Oscillospiraceae bacterium]|nr:LytTR family transcriptional regulator [Oscillospiraceae bacterium]